MLKLILKKILKRIAVKSWEKVKLITKWYAKYLQNVYNIKVFK